MVLSTLANVKKKEDVLRKSLFLVKALLFICVIQSKIILIQKTKWKIIKIKKLKKTLGFDSGWSLFCLTLK